MKPRIAVFMHQPRCSIQSGNGIIQALEDHYRFKIFTRHEVEDDFFDNVDLVCFPGGIGDSDSWDFLFKQHGQRIQRFVNRGGKYLGICMGAYWADPDYFNLLPTIRAVQYIRRPGTDIRRYYSTAARVTWQGQEQRMFFYDGCTYTGDMSQSKIIASYANGDPMAIINNNIGLIGCHPESVESWYDKPYLHKHWHKYQHHKLLRDFVDQLLD
jgi:glutamine amidotransferase-like uncharacterized protein